MIAVSYITVQRWRTTPSQSSFQYFSNYFIYAVYHSITYRHIVCVSGLVAIMVSYRLHKDMVIVAVAQGNSTNQRTDVLVEDQQ